MIGQLIIGTAVIAVTVAIQVGFISGGISILTRVAPWLSSPPQAFKTSIGLIGATLWLLAALTAGVWVWAAVFVACDIFETLEAALYFAVVTFTTLGYGDVTLPQEWRLLSGICAANGLILFGLSTAFLVEFLRRLLRPDDA